MLSTVPKNNACYSQGLGYITLIQLTMHPLATFLSDLSEAFEHESKGVSVFSLTKEEVTDGSVLLDPRNFKNEGTLSNLVKAKMLKKFGTRNEGVQFFSLTPLGFDTLFPA